MLLVTAGAGLSLAGDSLPAKGHEAPGASLPGRVLGAGPQGVAYVDEASCLGCHTLEAEKWSNSHHALAMQVAGDETVLGDFDNAVYEVNGESFRFFRRDGGFFAEVTAPGGGKHEYPVLYTFGVDPLQQYLVPSSGGRLQVLGASWDAVGRRWFDIDPDSSPPPGDAFHWTGRYQSWNAMCADCHSTNLRKGYDPESDHYRTTWSALNVGCQSCHGPGESHLAWTAEDPTAKLKAGSAKGFLETSAMSTAHEEIETCAPCHSRRLSIAGEAPLGGSFLDDYLPQVLHPGLYHPDGQILDEVYVYGSFIQSRMYRAGVTCSDCHDPHGLGLRAEGNALCTRCHGEQPSQKFPSLQAKLYDAPSHHRHEAGSEGSECVACHMPETTYMGIDPRRDHGMKVPRPDLSESLNVPNACSGCHADKTSGWAAGKVRDWYGPKRTHGFSWATALHQGRSWDPGALDSISALVESEATPSMVRATGVSLLPGLGSGAFGPLAGALEDPDPLVRVQAVIGLSQLPGPQRLGLLMPLIEDPVRAVRSEAGRALVDVPAERLSPTEARALKRAVAEYERGQIANSDLPPARLNLASLYAVQKRFKKAEAEYRAAISQDPLFVPAVANLAGLLDSLGRGGEAEEVLRRGAALNPDAGELHYSLGLLLAGSDRLIEATLELEKAAALLPEHGRPHYNLGLALQHLGQREQALGALERAGEIEPQNSDFARALAIFYFQDARYEEASREVGRWIEIAPTSAEAQSFLRRIQRARGASGRPTP
ncbi:MAG: tetratricopeptide repeat protein [Myxococcota bacterium]|nr:tetratricopeptide repeat protein [Myxococcota bacterium]